MAAKAKATPVDESANAVPVDKIVDSYVYIPGPQDLAHTEVNGIKFTAGVAVKIPRTKTVSQLVKESSMLPSGEVVTRAVEKRISMYEQLKNNPHFSINGAPPPVQAKGTSRMPQTPQQYVNWANAWILHAGSKQELETRWEGEEPMRVNCGVTAEELQRIEPFLEMKKLQFEKEAA